MEKIIFLLSFAVLFFALGVLSNPINTIFSEMQNDKDMCKTPEFFYNSSYTKSCKKAYKEKPLSINGLQDYDTLLCMAVYDIGYTICNLGSIHYIINLPESSIAFDKQIDKISITNLKELTEKCTSWWVTRSTDNYQIYNKVKPYVSQIYSNWKDHCKDYCVSPTLIINPLCKILIWAESTLQNVKVPHSPFDHTLVDESKYTSTNKSTYSEHKLPKETSDHDVKDSKPEIKNGKETEAKSDEIPENQGEKQPTVDNINKPATQIQSSTLNPPVEQAHLPILTDKKNKVNDAEQTEIPSQIVKSSDKIPENNKMEDDAGNYNLGSNDEIQDVNKAPNTGVKEDIADTQRKDTEYLSQPVTPNDEESHFLKYFSIISVLCIVLYIGFHNKQKILAIFLEGRRSRRGRNSRRRPSTASYRKLDCTLEEAVTSQCNSNITHVIY